MSLKELINLTIGIKPKLLKLIYLLLFQEQQEPWYITLLGVVAVFGLWAVFVLPRELRKKREEDEEYCKHLAKFFKGKK